MSTTILKRPIFNRYTCEGMSKLDEIQNLKISKYTYANFFQSS